MSKNKNINLGGRNNKLQKSQDYDLNKALAAIRKGSNKQDRTSEGTKTDIRIGSVNVNLFNTPEASSETKSSPTENYVTEQYVQSLVNNLRADQISNSAQLSEQFGQKIDSINGKIDSIKEKALSKNGYWGGIGIVVSIIGVIAAFILTDVQRQNERFDRVSDEFEEHSSNIESLDKKVKSLSDTIVIIDKKIEEFHKNKKK